MKYYNEDDREYILDHTAEIRDVLDRNNYEAARKLLVKLVNKLNHYGTLQAIFNYAHVIPTGGDDAVRMDCSTRMHTCDWWYQMLPKEISQRAMFYLYDKDYHTNSAYLALARGFDWANTDEGYEYWRNVATAYTVQRFNDLHMVMDWPLQFPIRIQKKLLEAWDGQTIEKNIWEICKASEMIANTIGHFHPRAEYFHNMITELTNNEIPSL
jgi:hypothetical protein